MTLAWNTRQLLSEEPKPNGEKEETGTPAEYHFLSYRRLYDSCIVTADKDHSSAGEWVALGDHHWYTIAVISRPTYALPQELCLSFDCFSLTETIGIGTSSGPPIEEVAIELGAVLSLLTREPITPLGVRRIGGKPVRLDRKLEHILRRPVSKPLPEAAINSHDLRAMLVGLANDTSGNTEAILAAAKLYHAALTLMRYDISTAYFSLVAAIECIAGHHYKGKIFDFDEVDKFKPAGQVINEISELIPESELPKTLKSELLRAEHFVGNKFRAFITEFLTGEFWLPDELYPDGYMMPKIEKSTLKKHLVKIYNARSEFAHGGHPFPDYIANGVSDWVSVKAAFQSLELQNTKKGTFVPVFPWFERLTHIVLVEYLFRVIAPELSAARTARLESKAETLRVLSELPEDKPGGSVPDPASAPT